MRVLVIGATGAIGTRLVPQLAERGHDVVGTSRSAAKADVALDLLDRAAVHRTVLDVAPDAIVHEATALGDVKMGRNIDKIFRTTNRLRTEGTDALLAAAREAGVERFVAQSFTSWPYARTGDALKTEEDPLDPTPPKQLRESLGAIRHVEQAVTEFGGCVLRYGGFYGRRDDPMVETVRKRQFPLIGDGTGIWSLVHLEDAAAATVLALESGARGIFNVVDDEPAPIGEWLPFFAETIGAKPPRHIPLWIGKVLGGEGAVAMATESRGASNAKAKRELGWTLRHPSWRQGFPDAYAAT